VRQFIKPSLYGAPDARIRDLSPTVARGCCGSSKPPQKPFKTVANYQISCSDKWCIPKLFILIIYMFHLNQRKKPKSTHMKKLYNKTSSVIIEFANIVLSNNLNRRGWSECCWLLILAFQCEHTLGKWVQNLVNTFMVAYIKIQNKFYKGDFWLVMEWGGSCCSGCS
jgi:hypothetical protein